MLTPELGSSNLLFVLARQGQRLPHIILAIVLAVCCPVLSALVGVVPWMLLVLRRLFPADAANPLGFAPPDLPVPSGFAYASVLIAAFLPIYGLLALWLRVFEKRPFATIGLQMPGAFFKYLRGFGFGLLMFAAAVGLMALLGFTAFEQGKPQMEGVVAIGGVLIMLVGWIVQGGAEEVLFRGWLMPVIGARYKPWLGILISCLAFAALHSLNPNLSLLALINLALFGLFTALYALREGGLWGVMALHSAWNWAQGNLFGLEVSGGNSNGGMLLNLMEAGPDFITGGNFGPEGGLIVTIVLLVGCAIVLARPVHKL